VRFVSPTYQNNLASFVRLHLSMDGLDEHEKAKGLEIRVQCPFCRGGQKNEFSFDINIDRGVARCWRTTCGWAGTGHRLYAEVLNISKRDAYVALAGDSGVDQVVSDFEAFDKLWLASLWSNVEDVDDTFNERVAGSVELMDANDDVIEEVREWIENRGYDFFKFIEIHSILIPPQFQKWEGYVLFEYFTNGNRTYQGYKFKKELLGLDVRPGTEYSIPKTMAASSRIKDSLYRYDELKPAGAVILCEGIFDAARLLSYGYQATCSFSTSVKEIQAYLLSQLNTKEIVVFFDYGADDDAYAVAKLISKYCESRDIKVSLVKVTKLKADPDNLSEKEVSFFLKRRKIISRGKQNEDLLKRFEKLASQL